MCCICFDEIYIRKHIQWCDANNTFLGLTNNDSESVNDPEVTTQVLVFMVCGLNMYFQLPVAYYYINSMDAVRKKRILSEVIIDVSKCGITVACVTTDGLITNITTFEMLGADFKNFKPHFGNPYNNENIHVIQDPCHMEKLTRNTLAARKTILDDQNNRIEWKYFALIEQLSEGNLFSLTHKINKRHIRWYERKMHVRTAVETLSKSTADSMEYLMNSGIPRFADAAATIKFIRIFNDLFDITNTFRMRDPPANQFKSAINPTNQREVFIRLSQIKDYILSLKIRKTAKNARIVPVLESDRKTAFRGFIATIISIENMYRTFVEEKHWLLFLATYRFSQDHIEMFFGKIRSRNGSNDNPTVQQFEAAFRKLLHQSDVLISSQSNVEIVDKYSSTMDITSNILTISSRRPKLNDPIDDDNTEESTDGNQETDDNFLEAIERDGLTDLFNDSGISFLAFKLEEKLLLCGQIYCEACQLMLENNEKLNQSKCVGNSRPCIDTYKICKCVNTALKIFENQGKMLKSKIKNYVFSQINVNQLYPQNMVEDHNGDSEEHTKFIVEYLVESFIRIIQTKSAKNKSLSLHKNFIRQNNRRNVNMSGQ